MRELFNVILLVATVGAGLLVGRLIAQFGLPSTRYNDLPQYLLPPVVAEAKPAVKSDWAHWVVSFLAGSSGAWQVDDQGDTARLTIETCPPEDPTAAQVRRTMKPVSAGEGFRLRLVVRAEPARSMTLRLTRCYGDWGQLGLDEVVPISSDWQEVEIAFGSTENESGPILSLAFGQQPGWVEFRSASIETGLSLDLPIKPNTAGVPEPRINIQAAPAATAAP